MKEELDSSVFIDLGEGWGIVHKDALLRILKATLNVENIEGQGITIRKDGGRMRLISQPDSRVASQGRRLSLLENQELNFGDSNGGWPVNPDGTIPVTSVDPNRNGDEEVGGDPTDPIISDPVNADGESLGGSNTGLGDPLVTPSNIVISLECDPATQQLDESGEAAFTLTATVINNTSVAISDERWRVVDAPTDDVDVRVSSDNPATITFYAAGTYQIAYDVLHGGICYTETVTCYVNIPAVVEAGPDQAVGDGTTDYEVVTMAGSVDPEGTEVYWAAMQAVPGGYEIEDTSDPTTNITITKSGEYKFGLFCVNDTTVYDTMTVTADLAWGVDAGPGKRATGGEVMLVATVFGVSESEIDEVSWSCTSKPTGADDPIILAGDSLWPHISGMDASGTYQVEVSVTRDDVVKTDTVSVYTASSLAYRRLVFSVPVITNGYQDMKLGGDHLELNGETVTDPYSIIDGGGWYISGLVIESMVTNESDPYIVMWETLTRNPGYAGTITWQEGSNRYSDDIADWVELSSVPWQGEGVYYATGGFLPES